MPDADFTIDELLGSSKTTLVEEGTYFKGTFCSECPIIVNGVIEGNVTAPTLTVGKTGAVRGMANVGQILSEGELAGEFDADAAELSGTIKDKTIVRAKSLMAKLSSKGGKLQIAFGEFTQGSPQAPGKKRS